MTGHTKEPWGWAEDENDTSDMGAIIGANGGTVCHFGNAVAYDSVAGDPPSEVDRARLFACVNALAGIENPAALGALIEAAENLVPAIDQMIADTDPIFAEMQMRRGPYTGKQIGEETEALRTALAALRGGAQ